MSQKPYFPPDLALVKRAIGHGTQGSVDEDMPGARSLIETQARNISMRVWYEARVALTAEQYDRLALIFAEETRRLLMALRDA